MHTHKLFMVPRGGFEPPTLGLEVLCSIQLSYQGDVSIVTKTPHCEVNVLWCGCGESNPDHQFGKLG